MNCVSRPASGEINQNNGGLCGGRGISKLCWSGGLAGTIVEQSIAARGFDGFAAKRPAGQGSKCLLTWFLVTLYQDKVTKPPRQLSGPTHELNPIASTIPLKLILPHHTLNRACSRVIVLSVCLGIVHRFNIAFHYKIDQLTNRHACINTHRLCAGNF